MCLPISWLVVLFVSLLIYFTMDLDDIIYLSSLLFSIGFGNIFRKIQNKSNKRCLATIVGVVIVLIVCGKHTLHPILCTLINSFIISKCNARFCHILSFSFTFAYLLFARCTSYFGFPEVTGHANLVQMILTLKLVGLAFEVHDSERTKSRLDDFDDSDAPSAYLETYVITRPSVADVFHYAFCYIGVLTGPYYKYKTYWDLFYTRHAEFTPCFEQTIERIKFVPLYMILFSLSTWLFPLRYVGSEEFYRDSSFLYRVLYAYPCFFSYRMRLYVGFILSECVCTMAGLGAYPARTQPKPGKGPTQDFASLVSLAASSDQAKQEVYNFETVNTVNVWKAESDPTVRGSMRYWNISVQYWLAAYVYHRFPKKSLRLFIVFVVSALWHGVYSGYYVSLCSVPLYLPVEDIFVTNFWKKEESRIQQYCWTSCLFFMKTYQFAYWGTTFQLLRISAILKYLISIYFLPYLLTGSMFLLGMYLKNVRVKNH
ncbi:unnamed protein product [Bemisia tabaci]|uniref:Lysophospholipid acyltransferase 7 n=1 Tax=Bemisia tabaci TaxID=7038 RepID=A0A9P0AH70_BEMTA|nr:unnamed protein product [Bemisia tabaci]